LSRKKTETKIQHAKLTSVSFELANSCHPCTLLLVE
jgi:hypothetical protein